MEPEVYRRWVPEFLKEASLRLFFLGLKFNQMGVAEFYFKSIVDGDAFSMKMFFDDWPSYFGFSNESFRLISIEKLPETRDGQMFVVERSRLLESFHVESLGIYKSDPLFHFCILTDEWIDIITSSLPNISIEPWQGDDHLVV